MSILPRLLRTLSAAFVSIVAAASQATEPNLTWIVPGDTSRVVGFENAEETGSQRSAISNDGSILVMGTMVPAGGDSAQRVILGWNAVDGLSLRMGPDSPIQGLPEGVVNTLVRVDFNHVGEAVVDTSVTGGGIFYDRSIVFLHADGTHESLVLENDPEVVFPGGARIGPYFRAGPRINDAGEVAFNNHLLPLSLPSNRDEMIWGPTGGQRTGLIVREGNVVPGIGGKSVMLGVTYPSLNNLGEIAFLGSFKHGLSVPFMLPAIFGPGADGQLKPLVLKNSAAAGAPAGTKFIEFREDYVHLNDLGQILFRARVTSGHWAWYLRDRSGAIRPIQAIFLPQPSIDPDSYQGDVRYVDVNDVGQVAYSIRYREPGKDYEAGDYEAGVWFVEPDGSVRRVARGDRVPPSYPFDSRIVEANLINITDDGDLLLSLTIQAPDGAYLENRASFLHVHPFTGPPLRMLSKGDVVDPGIGESKTVLSIGGMDDDYSIGHRGQFVLDPKFEDGPNATVLIEVDVELDTDADGIPDVADNCKDYPNPDQGDLDEDWIGDACNQDVDADQDRIRDELDNCALVANTDQSDIDGNGTGDACNDFEDADGDDIADDLDNCPDTANVDQSERDGDGLGDACDPFPDEPDNEKGQLRFDLAVCEATLVACFERRIFIDEDGDDEEDSHDACPNTPAGEPVGSAGCSLAEFCARVDDLPWSRRWGACMRADWLTDEMGKKKPRDCKPHFDFLAKGRPVLACIPY